MPTPKKLKCKNCGSALDPNPVKIHGEEEDGTQLARCPDCDRQYTVPAGSARPASEPEEDEQPEE